jgi:hypothetical protein
MTPVTVVISEGRGHLTQSISEESVAEMDLRELWAPPQTWPKPDEHGVVELRAWPLSAVRGKFSATAEERLPNALRVEFESSPGGAHAGLPAVPLSVADCTVSQDRQWTCAVPAATLDLNIRADSFIPQYRWDVVLKRGGVTDVGSIALRKGSSLVAWLDKATVAALGSQTATAQMTRTVMQQPSRLAEQLTHPIAVATFNKRGFVQVGPLPGGTFSLNVMARGFATSHIRAN